jgi:hypothetical protein
MSVNAYPRPGVVCLTCGAVLLGLSAVRVASHWVPDPGRLWFEFGNGVVGVALCLLGWSRLQRAKAARPDLNWWQFLHSELIGLGVVVVLLPSLAALSAEQRNSLVKSLMDLANLVSLVKGEP